MKFTVHRGTHEIGGNCVEVTAGKTRIVVDVGLTLDYTHEKFVDQKTWQKPRCHFPSTAPHVPKVPGLFQEGPPLDAILISHAHADHAGLLNYANPGIPVYCTQGTSKMLMAGSMFARQVKLERARESTIAPLKPTRIGDFVVTAYPVDHSAFDSVAFLIEADGKRLLYSGDLRLHGRKPGMAKQLLAAVASKPVDVLMMEGTHFSGQREAGCTEEELENKIWEHIRQRPGLVFANFSPMHVDRLVTLYKATRRAGQIFVVDPYAAFVLHLAAGQCRVPKPEAKNGIAVYYNDYFERTWQKRNLRKIRTLFLQDRIEMETILSNLNGYVMVCRPSMFKDDFRGTFPPNSTWIYSYWEGYLDRPGSEYPNLKARLNETGGEFVTYHTSGHIFADDIEKFVKAVNPGRVVPIHTTGRSEFQKRFKNVLLLEDGEINLIERISPGIMNPDPLPSSLHSLREETVEQLLKMRLETGLTAEQINNVLQQLARRIFDAPKADNPLRGEHILRFKLKTHLSDRNFAPETVFEKSLAQEAETALPSGQTGKWANQIPIWSGILESGGGKANIDIGFLQEAGKFLLYELKIPSNHPLYAVVELITYALGYIVIRGLAKTRLDDAKIIRDHGDGLLDAKAISFAVLAPEQYYDKKIPRHRIILCRGELENIRGCADELLTSVAKKHLVSDCVQIDFSLLKFKRNIPTTFQKDLKSRKNWITEVKGSGTLRDLVLDAEPL